VPPKSTNLSDGLRLTIALLWRIAVRGWGRSTVRDFVPQSRPTEPAQ